MIIVRKLIRSSNAASNILYRSKSPYKDRKNRVTNLFLLISKIKQVNKIPKRNYKKKPVIKMTGN